ncbi:T9SS type A sorting domain-containing protein [candidate division KSB1 bacterium]|nr:T9SS type A sorting domain-containing protein [candidate division KSB1 bacterium]
MMLLPLSISAQFAVVSTYPSDHMINVDPSTQVQIVFNQPLDITARYDDQSDLCIAFLLAPSDKRSDPVSFSFSSNNRQIDIYDFNLQPNTVYNLAVLAAKSTTRENLSIPVAITFSTGDTLPYGLMTGRAGVDGGNNTGAIVALYKNFMDYDPVALTVIDNAEGDYAMDYITGGIYYPMVNLDLNRDGNIKFDFHADLIGFYDPDQDSIPNPALVAEGWLSPVVDMRATSYVRRTARERFPRLQQWMQGAPPDFHLRTVYTEDLTSGGDGYFWFYDYESPTNDPYYITFFVTSAFIMPSSPDWFFPDSLWLPQNWIDSEAVMDTAFSTVGRFFLAEHPDALIVARLEMIDVTQDIFPGAINAGRVTASHLSGTPPLALRKKSADDGIIGNKMRWQTPSPRYSTPSLGDRVAAWQIWYYDADTYDLAFAIIDAVSGRMLRYLLPRANTAKDNLAAAKSEAQKWAPDAELILIEASSGGLDPNGYSKEWAYVFHSVAIDCARVFLLTGEQLIASLEVSSLLPGYRAIDQFIDSDQALQIAEQNGGSIYRQMHQQYQVWAVLSHGLWEDDPARLIWKFEYFDWVNPPLIIFVDGSSNDFITSADIIDGAVAEGFLLLPNYPNPFNAVTVIPFHVQSEQHIELCVYDIRGALVRRLTDEILPAGSHTVHWHGDNDAGHAVSTGVYFVRMQTKGHHSVRKIMLLR